MSDFYGKDKSSVGSLFDVHKHIVLISVLEQFKNNVEQFHFIDTNAGAGLYDIVREEESEGVMIGIDILMKANKNELTQKYFEIVRSYNTSLPFSKYPGSPLIARNEIRSSDTMTLIELDVDDYSELSGMFQLEPKVIVEHGSAFDRTLKLIPDDNPHGVILIDPDYIIDEDVTDTANLIIQCRNRWRNALVILCLPVSRNATKDRFLISLLKDSGVTDLMVSDFQFRDETNKVDVVESQKSRILIVNPQFEIKETLVSVFAQLASSLPISTQAKSSVKGI